VNRYHHLHTHIVWPLVLASFGCAMRSSISIEDWISHVLCTLRWTPFGALQV
jgi:hypothetical protein